jgi:hypothetical protein
VKRREIKSSVADREPGLIPTFDDTRWLPSAALSGSCINIQDPGFRFAPPWANVYHAFGVLLRNEFLKLP